MAATRSSKSSPNSQPSPKSATKAGSKRSSDNASSPPAKRGRPPKKTKKEQPTIEESMNGIEDDKDIAKQIHEPEKTDNKAEAEVKSGEDEGKENGVLNGDQQPEAKADGKVDEANGIKDGEKNAFDEVKADKGEVNEAAKEEQERKSKEIATNNESVVQDDKREAEIPSSILEKGVIYFFFRGRVGTEDPQGLEDVARSYIVLRPLPLGAKLGEGPLEDTGNARLLALPKKMLPKSNRDRFLVFVEKAAASIKDLREQFSGNEYATKTSGTSNTPAAIPYAEGVYAITSTGRESHLAYHVTAPEIGEVQKEFGLHEKGSFVLSVKNPQAPGPANATLSNPAKYPEEVQKKFRGLRWCPLEPELLNYNNTQLLLIGEGFGEMGKAVEEMSKDQKDGSKEKPEEEVQKLEDEDHDRVEHLKEDDPVFADLGLSSKKYSKMETTW